MVSVRSWPVVGDVVTTGGWDVSVGTPPPCAVEDDGVGGTVTSEVERNFRSLILAMAIVC